jgi:cytochrome c nitrite reductase small subunit
MKQFIRILTPPPEWRLMMFVMAGVIAGLFFFLFYISKAHSYLSDKSETCMNCHVMAPQYYTWSHSAHREVASCADCHVPHHNLFAKYRVKGADGLRHSWIFSTRTEPQVITIHPARRDVVQDNCIRCHSHLVRDDKLLMKTETFHEARMGRNCVDCHRETPHGRVNSLSSVPYARVPIKMQPVPDWVMRMTKRGQSQSDKQVSR